MINACKAKVMESESSSDDDDEDYDASTQVALAPGAESSLYLKQYSGISLYNINLLSSELPENDLDLHQPTKMKSVHELLREYRHLKENEPVSVSYEFMGKLLLENLQDCPSLDISDITLEEVYERAGICFQSEKNFALSVHKKRVVKEKPKPVVAQE